MNKQEQAAASAAIGLMLKAFPSSQSNISADMVRAYMMSVEDYDVGAIVGACKAFIKGEVKGRNNGFAPSAPELSNECQRQQDRLRWQAHIDSHDFVIEGSDEWRQLVQMRGSTPPTREVDGKRGWMIPKVEMNEARKLELPKPMAAFAIPDMKRIA